MLVIRQPVTLAEMEAGVRFYQRCYLRKYGTHPQEWPEQFFLAFDEDNGHRIVGSIEIRVGEEGRAFEVERYFHCSVTEILAAPRDRIGEIGRLASAYRSVTPYLFCAMYRFARRFGVQAFVSFNKKFVSDMLRKRLGFPISSRALAAREDVIPAEYASYFLDEKNPTQMLYGPVADWREPTLYWLARRNGSVRIELPVSLNEIRALATREAIAGGEVLVA